MDEDNARNNSPADLPDEREVREQLQTMQKLGKLSAALKEQFSQVTQRISGWFSLSSGIAILEEQFRNALSELRDVDTLLTEISQKNASLSPARLKKIAGDSFTVAGKYGRHAADYLSGVQNASLAGYTDAEGIAGLSLAVQNAGGISAGTAEELIFTTDEAYRMNGSVTTLTDALDGMCHMAQSNAVSMAELSQGIADVSSTAASSGLSLRETAAALGTLLSETGQDGAETAGAFRDILLYITQTADAEENIDTGNLKKFEEACNKLNVRLKETRNGVLSLRDPMEVLEELSAAYNRLGENDKHRSALLDSVGGKTGTVHLDALLSQWDTYEEMLQQFSGGAGFLAKEAERTVSSWEGSLNRLSNTWTDTIGNIVNSDGVVFIVNSLNGLLSAVNHVTEFLGPLGTIGTGAGITAFVKNFD